MSKKQEYIYKNLFIAISYVIIAMCIITFLMETFITKISLGVSCGIFAILAITYLIKRG